MVYSNTNNNILNGSGIRQPSEDSAAEIVPEYARAIDDAVERQVLRKVDMILIPFMWIGYGLVFYDKVTK